MIQVVDVFAGPGGLGEGFSSYRDQRNRAPFSLAVSMEKDPVAHQTLRLCALRRRLAGRHSAAYENFIRGQASWADLEAAHPYEAAEAGAESRCIELGPGSVENVRTLIDQRVSSDSPLILIGGPPCQAYSLAGRARNKGNAGYRPDRDKRQTLYVEYLQILADHSPAVFIMENVKGLLSAKLRQQHLFEMILDDLRFPSHALKREGRSSRSSKYRYTVRPLIQEVDLFDMDPDDYVVRAEEYGVPQRRHRVILLGIREDLAPRSVGKLRRARSDSTVRDVLRGLPRLRSGISKGTDSNTHWIDALGAMGHRRWLNAVDVDIRSKVEQVLEGIAAPRASRGAEYISREGVAPVLNHASRSHILKDLERYLFASAFGQVRKVSPKLKDFPTDLLPAHANVRMALGNGMFGDRFRVQLANRSSTTITSHISKDGHYYIHYDPTQCRSLTVREAARLQTFPDDYFFCGPRTSQYLQVGNAVPPKLAVQIAAIVAGLF